MDGHVTCTGMLARLGDLGSSVLLSNLLFWRIRILYQCPAVQVLVIVPSTVDVGCTGPSPKKRHQESKATKPDCHGPRTSPQYGVPNVWGQVVRADRLFQIIRGFCFCISFWLCWLLPSLLQTRQRKKKRRKQFGRCVERYKRVARKNRKICRSSSLKIQTLNQRAIYLRAWVRADRREICHFLWVRQRTGPPLPPCKKRGWLRVVITESEIYDWWYNSVCMACSHEIWWNLFAAEQGKLDIFLVRQFFFFFFFQRPCLAFAVPSGLSVFPSTSTACCAAARILLYDNHGVRRIILEKDI